MANILTQNDIQHVDYKDIDLLKQFVNPHGRVMGRKRTGLTAKQQRAVEAARNGVYRERSFRSLPPGLREKYFVRHDVGVGGLWQASSELHSRVSWRTANLLSEGDLACVATTSPVIFCRNVFIYFSDTAARKTVRVFAQRMARPAYLFVGAAESLMQLTSDFEPRDIGSAFVYTRSAK